MKREIKFRGKRLGNGEWVIGYYSEFTLCDGQGRCSYIKTDGCQPVKVAPATVGQYWRAINGKELFDGDIFRFKACDEWIVRLVRYSEDQAAFCIVNPSQLKHEEWMEIEKTPDASWWKEFVKDIEIIGNIHDNELLKTE